MNEFVRLLVLAVIVSGCTISQPGEQAGNAALIADERQLGEAAYARSDYIQAKVHYDQALKLGSKEATIFYRLGSISYRDGKFDSAAELFGKAIDIDPRFSKAHYNLATIRLMQAQDHFKYYTATADPKANIEPISKLIANIEEFAEESRKQK